MKHHHAATENPAKRRVRTQRRNPPARGGWRRRIALVVPSAVPGHALAPALATADRVTLVIGNGAYEYTSELRNRVNDTTVMLDAPTRLGFQVVFRRNPKEDALGVFEEMSAGADLALGFYAGYGLEMNGATTSCRSTGACRRRRRWGGRRSRSTTC